MIGVCEGVRDAGRGGAVPDGGARSGRRRVARGGRRAGCDDRAAPSLRVARPRTACATPARLNGFTALAITKVDVLGGMDRVPARGRIRGTPRRTVDDPPTIAEDYEKLRPVYEHLPGWPEFTPRLKERIRREGVAALPSELRRFLARLTEATGVPVEWISYGARRDETVFLGRGSPRAAPLSHWSA